MKKLMVMIGAAAAAFGLYAGTLFTDDATFEANSTGFIGVDKDYDFSAVDSLTEELRWFTNDTEEVTATVKAYSDSFAAPTGCKLNYLEIETDKPIYRTLADCENQTAMTPVAISASDRGGIEFDQWVKFTGFEEAPALDDGAKIAVWVRENETDGDDPTYTLMVTCGKIDGNVIPTVTNIEVCTLNDITNMHHLVIKAIDAIVVDKGTAEEKTTPGFIVVLDSTELTTGGSLLPAGFEGDASYTSEATANLTKIFPSIVQYDATNASTLQGVAYNGCGAIDEVAINAHPLYDIEIGITPPANALITKVMVGEDELTPGSTGKYTIVPGATVTVYLTRNGNYILSADSETFSNVSSDIEADDYSITSKKAVAWILEGSDVITTNLYASLQDAVDADKSGLIEMLENVTLASTLSVAKAIQLDLKGNTITLPVPTSIAQGAAAAHGIMFAKNLTGIVISNGTIAAASDMTSCCGNAAIYFVEDSALLKGLTLNLAGWERGLTHYSDETISPLWEHLYETDPVTTIACENVTVTGTRSVVHAEYVNMTFDKDCTVTQTQVVGTYSTADAHNCAIYSAANALVTIDGGEYTGANVLQTGNYGGRIDVKDGTFTGNIMSFMYQNDKRYTTGKGNTATITISGGDFTGDFTYGTGMPDTCTKDQINWNITGGKFSVDPTVNAKLATHYWAKKDGVKDEWTVTAMLKYCAGVYADGNPYTWAGVGEGDAYYAEGVTVDAETDGVTNLNGKTYYVSKLTRYGTTNNKVCEFEYDGETLKVKGTDEIGVTITGTTISYQVTTEEPWVQDKTYTDHVYIGQIDYTTYGNHKITITAPENGTLETSVTNNIAQGTTVTVTATPNEGYSLKQITVNGEALEKDVFTFTMPDADVTVAAEFSEILVESVTLNESTTNVTVGSTITLTATVTPETALQKEVTWTSSDETKATVDDGVVTGVAAGSVTITAEAGGKSATCTVEVTSSAPTPVEPGTKIDVPSGKTQSEFIDDINTSAETKAQYVKVPNSDTFTTKLSDAQTQTYASYFTAVADGDNGVKMVYDESKDTEVKADVDAELSKVEITGDETSTIDAIPGFFYRFVGGIEVGTIATTGVSVQAEGGESVTLTKPTLTGLDGKAFYKIEVSATEFAD